MTASKLAGLTALVTGGVKRIGHELSLTLAREGVNIVLQHRNSDSAAAAEFCGRLAEYNVKAWHVEADFEHPEDSGTLVQRTLELTGSLEILINNASIFPPGTLQDLDLKTLLRNVEVNAWAPFILSRNFADLAGRGKIINLLDTKVAGSDPVHAGYILSKHLLYILTRMCAIEYAPRVAVNAIAPGLILPPAGKDESYLARLADTVPLHRHGSPADVADAALYLLRSEFVTGQVIYVDGGRHLMESSNG